MTKEEARRQALIQAGRHHANAAAVPGTPWLANLDALAQDLRYSVRMLSKSADSLCRHHYSGAWNRVNTAVFTALTPSLFARDR